MGKCIFIFRHYASPPYLPGGQRHFNIAHCMKKNGHEVYLFVSNFRHNTKNKAKEFPGLYMVEIINGINIVWIKNISYKKNDLRRFLGMIHFGINVLRSALRLKSQKIKPNIVIGSVAHIFSVLSAYIVAKMEKCRFWMETAELWPEQYIQGGVICPRHPLAVLLNILSSFCYRKAERIICVKENTKRVLKEKGIINNKIVLFPQGIILPEIMSKRNSEEENDGFFTIIYAGALNLLYPVEELIDVAEMIKDYEKIKIVIYGDGIKKSEMLRDIYRRGLNNIKIFNLVPFSDLSSIYLKAAVLMVIEHNVEYGFSAKLIEYMLAGKPIILASESEYDLPKDVFLRVKPKAAAIAELIIELYLMEKLELKKLGKAVSVFAHEKMNMQKNYNTIIEPLISSQ